jgi:hypothetical protein
MALFIKKLNMLTRFWPLVFFSAVFLFPFDALAWGPVTHIDQSWALVAWLAALAPAIHRRIARNIYDFLHGSLAPDMILAKNMAAYSAHSHSWPVAQKLYLEAKALGEPMEIFMLGYLTHLAADVVAHNHFVPGQLIKWHGAKGAGHLYWEARYDQKIKKENPRISGIWRDLSKRSFPDHNRFLTKRLSPTLFPNRVSSQIYRQILSIQRRRPWNKAVDRIDATSKLGFSHNDALKWRKAAMMLVLQVAVDPSNHSLIDMDPTGRSALASAMAHRRMLRRSDYFRRCK